MIEHESRSIAQARPLQSNRARSHVRAQSDQKS
jgi:hypothetical protein